jgi:hypothetical protein
MPLSRVVHCLALVLPVAAASVADPDRSSAAPGEKGRAIPHHHSIVRQSPTPMTNLRALDMPAVGSATARLWSGEAGRTRGIYRLSRRPARGLSPGGPRQRLLSAGREGSAEPRSGPDHRPVPRRHALLSVPHRRLGAAISSTESGAGSLPIDFAIPAMLVHDITTGELRQPARIEARKRYFNSLIQRQ